MYNYPGANRYEMTDTEGELMGGHDEQTDTDLHGWVEDALVVECLECGRSGDMNRMTKVRRLNMYLCADCVAEEYVWVCTERDYYRTADLVLVRRNDPRRGSEHVLYDRTVYCRAEGVYIHRDDAMYLPEYGQWFRSTTDTVYSAYHGAHILASDAVYVEELRSYVRRAFVEIARRTASINTTATTSAPADMNTVGQLQEAAALTGGDTGEL
jgi:hypothetical protein